jgi:hypothetical protein
MVESATPRKLPSRTVLFVLATALAVERHAHLVHLHVKLAPGEPRTTVSFVQLDNTC